MANEGNISISLNATKGELTFSASESDQFTVTTGKQDSLIVTATTAGAGVAVSFASLTTPRWAIFKNLDATDNVRLGPQVTGTFAELIELLPGESCVFPIDGGNSVYCQASANTPLLYARALEL